MCAAVEPSNAAAEKRHPQITCREVVTIDIGDFEFTARRRPNLIRNGDYALVVEVKTGNREARSYRLGLFFEGNRASRLVAHDHAKARSIRDLVSEYSRTAFMVHRLRQQPRQAGAIENVIAQSK